MKEADYTMLRKSAGSNALGTAGSVRTIGLPIRMLELENKSCSRVRKEVWAAVTSKVSRDSGRSSFSPSH